MKANKPQLSFTTLTAEDEDYLSHNPSTEELLAPATAASKSRLKGILRVTTSINQRAPDSTRIVSSGSSVSINKRASVGGGLLPRPHDDQSSQDIIRKRRVSFLTEKALSVVAKNNCFVLKLGFVQHTLYNCRHKVLFGVAFSYLSALSLSRSLMNCGLKRFNQSDGFIDYYQVYPNAQDHKFKRGKLNMRGFTFRLKDIGTDRSVLKFKRSSPYSMFGQLKDDKLYITTPHKNKRHLGIVRVPLERYGDFYEIEDEDGYVEFEIPPRIVTHDDEFFYEVTKFEETPEMLQHVRKNYKKERSNRHQLENVVGITIPTSQDNRPPPPPIVVTSSSMSLGTGEHVGVTHLFKNDGLGKSDSKVIYPGEAGPGEDAQERLQVLLTPEHALKRYLLHIHEGSKAWVARIFMEKRHESFSTDSKGDPKLRAGEVLVLFNDILIDPSPGNRVLSEEQKARIIGAALFIRVRELSSAVPYPIIPS